MAILKFACSHAGCIPQWSPSVALSHGACEVAAEKDMLQHNVVAEKLRYPRVKMEFRWTWSLRTITCMQNVMDTSFLLAALHPDNVRTHTSRLSTARLCCPQDLEGNQCG